MRITSLRVYFQYFLGVDDDCPVALKESPVKFLCDFFKRSITLYRPARRVYYDFSADTVGFDINYIVQYHGEVVKSRLNHNMLILVFDNRAFLYYRIKALCQALFELPVRFVYKVEDFQLIGQRRHTEFRM